MKRRIIPLALCMALLLSGCGLTEQWATVREEYIDPAIERADGEAEPVESGIIAPNVGTDRTELTDYVPFEAVFTRAQDETITSLTPSESYGRLLPFGGGLVTETGEIVLDPVYVSITPVSSIGGEVLDIYAICDENGMYAVCGADGSWISGFDYTAYYPMELGVLCVSDSENCLAVCYDEAGEVVFDTANFSDRSMMEAVETLAQCENGLMLCTYQSGRKSFLRADGTALNRAEGRTSYFDDALAFSEGLAAVKINGLWGYIDTEGEYVVQPAYERAMGFTAGCAAVYGGGMWQIIDATGAVRLELPGVENVSVGQGYINADGTYYNTTTFEQAVFYGYTGVPVEGGFWVRGETGVRVFLSDGSQVYFSGAAELLGHSGKLWYVELADGSRAVMDGYSRVVIFGDCEFVRDEATGETYIINADGTLYHGSGAYLASGSSGQVIDGFTWCSDGISCGWKSAGGEWIFRVPYFGAD